MVASNSRGQAPFLTYLTVFKSRLGVVNIVLPLTGFTYQSEPTLSRRLRERLSQSIPFDPADPDSGSAFDYLVEKKLVGAGTRKTGRYKDVSLFREGTTWRASDRAGAPLSRVPVFQTDVWMADPALESTIGVPTPENSDEVLELCFQLGVLSKSKHTWTAAGQLVRGLRDASPHPSTNPMRIGLEVVPLLRQLVEKDGLLLRELLRHIHSKGIPVRRDDVAREFGSIAEAALRAANSLRLAPPILAEGKRFVALIKKTTASRDAASRAPGVLEHRISPRLEWLTDLGVLTKHGLPKNGFEYKVTSDATTLLNLLIEDPGRQHWADDIALEYWRRSAYWRGEREGLPQLDPRAALRQGYRIMQRSVGPTSIRDVCLAAGALAPSLQRTLEELTAELVEWASAIPGITVSGGRYTRKPELVHMTPEAAGQG